MGPRPAQQQRADRVVDGFEERVGNAAGRDRAERVAVPARVLGRDQPLLADDPHGNGPVAGDELAGEVGGGPRPQLLGRQVAEAPQQVVGVVGARGPSGLVERLELGLELCEDARVDELAQLLGAEELGQQVTVEAEGLGPPFGQRSVALVEERGDVRERERGCERRGPHSVDRDDAHAARPDIAQELDQRGQVEDVAQAFAVGLEQDRERAVLRRHRQQVGRPLALLPQGRAGTRPPAGEQQGTGGVLAEPGGEQRAVGDLADDEVLDLVGLGKQLVERRRLV